MHQESLDIMQHFLERIEKLLPAPIRVLDVGSKRIGDNPTYRDLISDKYSYVGLDIEAGNNVDIVVPPYSWKISDQYDQYDLVISGQAFEHIEFPWLTILEIAKALKPGGYAVIIVPTVPIIHRFPVDCWRILPDGLTALAKWANLDVIEVSINQYGAWGDAWGFFQKPK